MEQRFDILFDNDTLNQVETSVSAVCDRYHLDNYYATLSVAVMSVVRIAQEALQKAEVEAATLHIGFEYGVDGLVVTIETDRSCFGDIDAAVGDMDSPSYLVHLLADGCCVSDEGRCVTLTFAIRGIDVQEAGRRVSVLEHFRAPVVVEV